MAPQKAASDRFRALLVGGGVASIEAALALRELGGDRVQTTVLAPNRAFLYRPMSVREPFGRAGAAEIPMSLLLSQAGASQTVASLRWLDHAARLAHTSGGQALGFDALLLAVGAQPYPRYPRAVTLDPARLDEQLHGIIQDIEMGSVQRVVFIIPPGRFWPLPLYELALMTAKRADEMGQAPEITLITSERAPLDIFGETASAAVAAALSLAGIELITDATVSVPVAGRVRVAGTDTELGADAIVALPELRGPSIAGVPASGLHGFISVDAHGRVRRLKNVFAAGDITDYPVKQGAIAAQQGACVAQVIAGMAGVPSLAEPFEPIIHGMLLGPAKPLYLRARLVDGQPATSEASETPLWDSPDKIHAPYLSRALKELADDVPGLTGLSHLSSPAI